MTVQNEAPPTAIFPNHAELSIADAPMAIPVGAEELPISDVRMAILVGVGEKPNSEGAKEEWRERLLPIRQTVDNVASFAKTKFRKAEFSLLPLLPLRLKHWILYWLVAAVLVAEAGMYFGHWGFVVVGALFLFGGLGLKCLDDKGKNNTVTDAHPPVPTPQTSNPTHKQCPFCAEVIRFEATLCRFCNKLLSEGEVIPAEAPCVSPSQHIMNAQTNMRDCPVCKATIASTATICPKCGDRSLLNDHRSKMLVFVVFIGFGVILVGWAWHQQRDQIDRTVQQIPKPLDESQQKRKLETTVQEMIEENPKWKLKGKILRVALVHEGGNKWKGFVDGIGGKQSHIDVTSDETDIQISFHPGLLQDD